MWVSLNRNRFVLAHLEIGKSKNCHIQERKYNEEKRQG